MKIKNVLLFVAIFLAILFVNKIFEKENVMLTTEKVIKSEKFEKAERIVIVLHGYGSSGKDFAEVGEIFLSKKLDNTVFLFPDAPHECRNAHFPGEGREWFPLSQKLTIDEIRDGLDKSAPILNDYIESSSKKYNCNNVNLIGFSQGSIMALEMLYYPNISKIVAYSGIFAMPEKKEKISNPDVLIVHSNDDEVVPYNNAISAEENLKSIGVRAELKTCQNIGHSISLEGWDWCVEFLKR